MRSLIVLSLLVATQAEAGKGGKKRKAQAEPVPIAAPAPLPLGELIALPCGAEPGATWLYESVRHRSDRREPTLEGTSTVTPLTVTWAETGPPAIVTWTHGKSQFRGLPEDTELDDEARLATEILADLPMEVVVEAGVTTGVRNLEEIVGAMEPLFQIFEADSPEAAAKAKALFLDPAQGPPLLLRDVRPFWAMVCGKMHVGETVTGPTQFPNPFGGMPIAGTESFALQSVDKTAGTATYSTLTKTDPDGIIAAVEPILRQMLPAGGDEAAMMQALDQLPPIDTRAEGAFIMSLADGMPIQVQVTQTIGAGDVVQRSDTWIWTRQ
jgi:hypothetical protein